MVPLIFQTHCSLVLVTSIIQALILASVKGDDPISVKVKFPDKLDLSATDLTTSYCEVKGKECPGANLASTFAATAYLCHAYCSRNVRCLSAFYTNKKTCNLRAERCTEAELTTGGGTNYYRLKKRESCPEGQPAYVPPRAIYSHRFCVMKDKSCPGNDLYPKPQNIMPYMECLKKCVKIKTCSGVDFNGLCSPKETQCADDELVDTPGTDNYMRLKKKVTRCPENRSPPGGGDEAGADDGRGDCKFSEYGIEYNGKLSVTNTGKTCLNWEGHPNPYHLPKDDPTKYFPEKNLTDAKNYCRNGDETYQGPWCYIDNEGHWEACKIPYCPENSCRTSKRALDYNGKLSVTKNGKKCLNWATHPTKSYLDSANYTKYFPEKNLEDAKNYCRNGDDSSRGPWCYIDETGDYELCDILYCPTTTCRFTDQGLEYNGKLNKTPSGKDCLNWATHPTKKYLYPGEPTKYFPEDNLEDAKNYCRNGDRGSNGPWCYIDDEGGFESCDIPFCT